MSSKNISVNLTESTLKFCGRQRSVSSRLNSIADRYALVVAAIGETLRAVIPAKHFDAIAEVIQRPDFDTRDVAAARAMLDQALEAQPAVRNLVGTLSRAEFVVLLELVEAQA